MTQQPEGFQPHASSHAVQDATGLTRPQHSIVSLLSSLGTASRLLGRGYELSFWGRQLSNGGQVKDRMEFQVFEIQLGSHEARAPSCVCRYRMAEIGTAYDLLNALNKRQGVPDLALSGGLGDPAAFFGGRLDMRAVALAGHSYGGATVGALTAGDARFRAGVALDPWW